MDAETGRVRTRRGSVSTDVWLFSRILDRPRTCWVAGRLVGASVRTLCRFAGGTLDDIAAPPAREKASHQSRQIFCPVQLYLPQAESPLLRLIRCHVKQYIVHNRTGIRPAVCRLGQLDKARKNLDTSWIFAEQLGVRMKRKLVISQLLLL